MTRLTEKSIIRCRPDVISQKIAGSVYLIDHHGQTVRILNRTAGFIWEKIKKQISVAGLIRLVTKEFEVSPARAGKEVLGFISRYANYGLIMLKQVSSDPEPDCRPASWASTAYHHNHSTC